MVLLVIEDHPLRKLAYQVDKSEVRSNEASWSLDATSMGYGGYRNPGTEMSLGGYARLSTLLKPFNLTLTYRTETLPSQSVTMAVTDTEALMGDYEGNWPTGTLNDISGGLPQYANDSEAIRGEALAAAESQVQGAKQNRNNARAQRRAFKRDPYSAVESIKWQVPKVTTMMIEGIEIISEGITTSVNDMVTEVVIQFMAQDVKQLSALHESNELSFAPEDLPSDIYAELRGQAIAESSDVKKETMKEMKAHEKALRQEVRAARRERREVRRYEAERPWGGFAIPNGDGGYVA